jgi:uncharacterized membrane protein YphA (DoxX/SURF4 family)
MTFIPSPIVQAVLVGLFLFLVVTIPAAVASWSVWFEMPQYRRRAMAYFHWLWLVLALVMLIEGIST